MFTLSIWLALAHVMKKPMAPHSSTLAWRIPGTEEPVGLPSMGSHRVRHDWCDLAHCCCSVPKSCPALCNPMDCSTWGFPVLQCSKSCPLSQWCHPSISSSVALLFSCPQSFPISGIFQMRWLSKSGDQITVPSVSASVLPVSIQGWYPLGLTGSISLLSKSLSRIFSNNTIWKHQFFGTQPSLRSTSPTHMWILAKS